MAAETKWLLSCAAFALGEVAGFAAGAYSPWWPAAAGGAALCALVGWGFSLRGWPFAAVFAAGFALALHAADSRRLALAPYSSLSGGLPRPAVLSPSGAVRPSPSGLFVFPSSLSGLPVRVCVPASLLPSPPAPGERWLMTGSLAPGPLFSSAPRTFRVRGRAVRLSPSPLSSLRADLSRRAGIGLSPSAAALNRSMLLGERWLVPDPLRRDFIAAGTVHLFAISGLHVLLVAR
ncbi:MAG: ComEC/Rec2 family competence protein, partial [Kiritimatiellae bacterium]|nr:ComEC/Rec2 family competence protein [Kiritimatiellia bacterium]